MPPSPPRPQSQAQVAFDTMKTLAGEWEGPVTTDLPPEMRAEGR